MLQGRRQHSLGATFKIGSTAVGSDERPACRRQAGREDPPARHPAIAESTGNWPISTYFTAIGLDPDVAAAYPWNRAPRRRARREHRRMPEDDDLNFAIVALMLVEQRRGTDHRRRGGSLAVAAARRPCSPLERIAYRNLLDGHPPAVAGNPFQDWIGAQIRTDVYGWVLPGESARQPAGVAGRPAEPLAQRPVRGDVRRRGVVHGRRRAVDAWRPACRSFPPSAATPWRSGEVPSLVKAASTRRRRSTRSTPSSATSTARAQQRRSSGVRPPAATATSRRRSRPSCQWLGHRLDGATAGSICGALTGALKTPSLWTDPLANRLSTSMPGLDGIGFDELARRTAAARLT